MNIISILPWILATSIMHSCNQSENKLQEEWNRANAPSKLSAEFTIKFDLLPLNGATKSEPWSDSYWPSKLGGIGARWQSWIAGGSMVAPASAPVPKRIEKASASQLSSEEISMLSPAEKYDLYLGKFGFPLLDSERVHVSERDSIWEGICHGWASASLHFEEPKPREVENSKGQKISFASSDIKALLSYYMANVNEGKIRVLGARCNHDLKKQPDARFRPECKDTNAGSFHIAMANLIGIQKKGLIADIYRDEQVWNQPIFSFSSSVEESLPVRQNSAPAAKEILKITTEITYADELYLPSKEVVLGTSLQKNTRQILQYYVELDEKREVVGGEWIGDFRPDFIWLQEMSEMRGYWKPLSKLAKPLD